MITWFDALLVTLWAVLTALGARRGLAGLAWGIGGVAVCFLANSLAIGPVVSTLIALLLGVGVALAIGRLIPMPLEQPWHLVAGAAGGFMLGWLMVATLALGFPLDVKVTPKGQSGVYPSPSLSPVIYDAVRGSTIKNSLMSVWSGSPALRTLIIPDQAGGLKP